MNDITRSDTKSIIDKCSRASKRNITNVWNNIFFDVNNILDIDDNLEKELKIFREKSKYFSDDYIESLKRLEW